MIPKSYLRRMSKYENAWKDKIELAIVSQFAEAASQLEVDGFSADIRVSSYPIEKVLEDMIMAVVPKEIDLNISTYERMFKASKPTSKAKKVARKYAKSRPVKGMVKRITETTKRLIKIAIEQAIEKEYPLAKVVRIIMETAKGIAKYRAERIARTEIVRHMAFSNYTSAIAMKVWVKKEWSAIDDKRTRDTHRGLDGQKKELWQPFRTKNGEIWYPCDPKAVPAETINCRCALMYIPVRDANGLPQMFKPAQLEKIAAANELLGIAVEEYN